MIYRSATIALLAVLALGACAESDRQEASGKGNIRGVNAIVTSPDVSFKFEERTQALLAYKDAAAVRFDDLPINVNFDVLIAGDSGVTRIASAPVDIVANTEHLLMLTGSMAAPVVRTLEFPERQWIGDETVFEARALHLAATASDLDVYYAAPGTPPVLGDARATLAIGEISSPFEVAAGDYELTLTTRDDPGDVLYRSRTVSQAAAVSVIYGVFDPDPSITGDLSVRVIGTSSAELADVNAPPTLRLMHAAFSIPNIDFFANNDFTTALVTNLGFGELTTDFDFELGSIPLTVTPTGDTGVILLESSLSVVDGSRNSLFLVGDVATPALLAFPDDRRPVATAGRIRVMQLAANADAVDLYVYLTTEDINEILPRFPSLPFRASTGYASFAAESYLVALTLPGEKDIIAGPLPLDLALGGIAELAIRDTVDPNLLELVIYDN